MQWGGHSTPSAYSDEGEDNGPFGNEDESQGEDAYSSSDDTSTNLEHQENDQPFHIPSEEEVENERDEGDDLESGADSDVCYFEGEPISATVSEGAESEYAEEMDNDVDRDIEY